MFDGFRLDRVDLWDVTLRVRRGGSGPAVLLLHGSARTHLTWRRVAPLLANSFTVVCPDLRGYGQSSQPAAEPDDRAYSKHEMVLDCLALMKSLGHDRFAVVGHDRGAHVAFRLAIEHPTLVTGLALLDALPLVDTAPADGPDAGEPGEDRAADAADRAAGRRLGCPTLILWATRGLGVDPLANWRQWHDDAWSRGIDSGHHLAEEAPGAVAAALCDFLSCRC